MKLQTIFAFGALLSIGTFPLLADIYGTDPLAPAGVAGINDYCTGCLFAYAQAAGSANGQDLTEWSLDTASVYDNHDVPGGNGVITPLLFDSNFMLVGIGTTQMGLLPGHRYTFAFGLTQGSAIVHTGYYFGWVDGNGTASGGGNGSIAITDLNGGPGVLVYTCDNTASNGAAGNCVNTSGAVVGHNYGPETALGQSGSFGMTVVPSRTYQVNFATPEPESVLLLMIFGIVAAVISIVAKYKFVR